MTPGPTRVGPPPKAGMSPGQARWLEGGIIGLCVLALVAIFQPFSRTLFGIGCGLVVFAGLAFNLVPIARPGVRALAVLRAALIVAVVFVIVTALGIGSAKLYGVWLQASRG